MNYLAHLHLADVANSDMLGNLLGDFAKGDPSKQYSSEIVQGIRLHRAVDKFVDTHGIVQACKKRFPEAQRRFALIALDMFWDHCLAMHWHLYSDISLDSFVHYAQREVAKHGTKDLPPSFLLLNQRMWQGKWLQSYRKMDNIEFALHRMSQRDPDCRHCLNVTPHCKTNMSIFLAPSKRFMPTHCNLAATNRKSLACR